MPRPLRIQTAGFVHHVIARGNDRQALFISPEDFRKFLDILDATRKQFPLHIYNYCLMDNHLHLLVEPLEDGALSKVMQITSKEYAKYFNYKYERTGHVFEGRFKSFLIQKERYFFACSRYIDLNSVKARVVAEPQKYIWSGYARLGYGEKAAIKLDQHDLYMNLGANDTERQIAYRALVMNYPGEDLDLMNQRASILGDRTFKKNLKSEISGESDNDASAQDEAENKK